MGVMVAMEEEAQFIYPLCSGLVELPKQLGIVKCTRGTLGGLSVDIVISGIGAVYAAMATTAVLLQGPVSAVISCGCAGAHLPEQVAGDIVLGERVVPLSAEVIMRDGKSRHSGIRCSMLDSATYSYMADPQLLRLAAAAAAEVCDEDRSAKEVDSSKQFSRTTRVDVGTVGSSDV